MEAGTANKDGERMTEISDRELGKAKTMGALGFESFSMDGVCVCARLDE